MKNRILPAALLLCASFAHAQMEVAPERTWTLETGKEPAKGVVTYTATGFIATNEANGIRLVNPQSGKNAKLSGHGNAVRLLVNSPDNKYLLSASDENIRLWDLVTLTDTEVKADGLNEWLRTAALAEDVKEIAGNNSKVGRIAGALGKISKEVGKRLSNERTFASIKAINIAFGQNCLIGNNAKGRLQILLWNAASGIVDTLASLPRTDNPDDLMFISPNNEFIAHNYTETAVTRIWLNGPEHTTVPYTNKLFGFSPDGKELATAVQGGIALWDPATGVNTRFLAADPDQEATAFTFHRLNRFYAGVFTNKTTGENSISLWDATSGRKLRSFLITNPVLDGNLCFNYEGNFLACRMTNNTLATWDVRKLLNEVPSFSENLLAKVKWISPTANATAPGNSFDLKACIESATNVQDVRVFVNGTPLAERGIQAVKAADAACENSFSKTIQLQPGENAVYLQITNSAGNSYSETRYLQVGGAKTTATLGKRLALVIGNAGYKQGPLRNPVNDAKDIATALKEQGFEVIQVENLDRRKFQETVRTFTTKLRGYDVGLVFYAGHGVQVQGKNYLIPVDADLQTEADVQFNCYALDNLLAELDGTAKANIIILDACRNNPFEGGWKRSATGSGLGMVGVAPKGTLIAFATSPGSTAEDGQGKNGTYTGALLQHIRTKGLSAFQLFSRVIGAVDEQTQGAQLPWMLSSLSSDIILTR
ncbi:MAG: caspase family protein [Haliscomenobacter sp.]|nr:caspase family protein [Haliscomenobacter sp.]